jgi:threonine dehydrogenase-like Zn-dependent dehydrogenase
MAMKAAVVTRPQHIEIQSRPIPTPKDEDALIKIEMCGICGTDVHLFYTPESFPLPMKMPYVLGHEYVGVIVEKGSRFPTADHLGNPIDIGDRVVYINLNCGRCYACRTLLAPWLCMGGVFDDPGEEGMGAFAERFYIKGEGLIYRVPDDVPTDVAVLVDPIAIALAAVQRAHRPGAPDRLDGLGLGQTVVVQGAGAIGASAAALAKLSGATQVIVIGAPQPRLDICKRLGADHVINIDDMTDPAERLDAVRAFTPHNLGADVVIEAAGIPQAFAEALELARRGGTIVEVGSFTRQGTIEFDPSLLCYKHLNIHGSWTLPPAAFGSVLEIMRAFHRTVPFSDMITHRFDLDGVREGLETSRRLEALKAVIVP